jgi:hypothetical protein
MGFYTTASGFASTAMGREIEASGDYSVAIALNDQNGATVSQDNTMAIMGGKVGINTTSPIRMLHLEGTTPELQFRDTGRSNDGWHIGQMTDDFQVVESNIAPRVTVKEGGKVGINTTSPAQPLEVSSVMRLTPTNSPGSCNAGTEGSVYYSSDFNELCFCDGSSWKRASSLSACFVT